VIPLPLHPFTRAGVSLPIAAPARGLAACAVEASNDRFFPAKAGSCDLLPGGATPPKVFLWRSPAKFFSAATPSVN